MKTDQDPLSDLPPVPEDDDLHAGVIEVLTDIEVLLDGSSVVDVFAVSFLLGSMVNTNVTSVTADNTSSHFVSQA